jgi:hypothetical protein
MTVATKTEVDLDQLRAREAELVEKVEAKRASLDEYPAKIAEENLNLVYAGKRPLTQLNTPLQKLRDAEKKDATTLTTLEGELSAVRTVIAEEAARLDLERTAAARAHLAELHAKEEAVWKESGELLGELSNAWNKYVALAEEEDRLATANGLDGSSALAVVPSPRTFRDYLLLLHKVATDDEVRLDPYEEQLIDSGTFRGKFGEAIHDIRPAGTRQVEVRRKLDYGDRLIHLVPDLRSVVHKVQLSGRIPTIAE